MTKIKNINRQFNWEITLKLMLQTRQLLFSIIYFWKEVFYSKIIVIINCFLIQPILLLKDMSSGINLLLLSILFVCYYLKISYLLSWKVSKTGSCRIFTAKNFVFCRDLQGAYFEFYLIMAHWLPIKTISCCDAGFSCAGTVRGTETQFLLLVPYIPLMVSAFWGKSNIIWS